jgi:hypothetical protein
MFSLLNKAGELGMRFSKPVQERYIVECGASKFRSYGAETRGIEIDPDRRTEIL